jgi:hypothetical protein
MMKKNHPFMKFISPAKPPVQGGMETDPVRGRSFSKG